MLTLRRAARRTFIPRRRPWNRRLHVHAHTRVYASARLRCVGGSPSCRMFPERFYSPCCSEVGVASPQPPPLFRVLDDVCVVVCAPLTGFLLARWDGCAGRSWWDWQQSSCSLACSSALLNRCCGDEGARRWLLPIMSYILPAMLEVIIAGTHEGLEPH